jgi:hypothetical protein
MRPIIYTGEPVPVQYLVQMRFTDWYKMNDFPIVALRLNTVWRIRLGPVLFLNRETFLLYMVLRGRKCKTKTLHLCFFVVRTKKHQTYLFEAETGKPFCTTFERGYNCYFLWPNRSKPRCRCPASTKCVLWHDAFKIFRMRSSTLVSSNRLSHALTRNLGSTQQKTCTISCLVSCLIKLYNSLICAYKKGILLVAWQQQLIQ